MTAHDDKTDPSLLFRCPPGSALPPTAQSGYSPFHGSAQLIQHALSAILSYPSWQAHPAYAEMSGKQVISPQEGSQFMLAMQYVLSEALRNIVSSLNEFPLF